MRLALTLAIAAAVPAASLAETLTFEAEDGFVFLRCVAAGPHASCEVLADADVFGLCVALDANGSPIASTSFAGAVGKANFPNIDVDLIDRVACRAQ
jgi:hypothetical protein